MKRGRNGIDPMSTLLNSSTTELRKSLARNPSEIANLGSSTRMVIRELKTLHERPLTE